MIRVVSALFAIFVASSVYGLGTVRDFEKEAPTGAFQLHIQGVETGLSWANTILKDRKQAPLYCQPEKLVLTTPQVIDIIRRTLEKDTFQPDMTIDLVLAVGLMNTFPCHAAPASP